MKGDSKTLLKFLDRIDVLKIPVYQRSYSWNKEECRRLFSDILRVAKGESNTHFIGSIVNSCEDKDCAVIIDGQQRITTISLMLLALKQQMENSGNQNYSMIIRKIGEKYLLNPYDDIIKLQPYKPDHDTYEALVRGRLDQVDKTSKLWTNYKYFLELFERNQEVGLDKFLKALDCLNIIDIEINPAHGDDAQLIFESINSTGLALQESDKIRNLILMNLSSKEQEEYFENYWVVISNNTGSKIDEFIRDYLTLKTGSIPSIGKIYQEFNKFVQSSDYSIKEILVEIKSYSTYYKAIKEASYGSEEMKRILFRLGVLDVSVTYPFLLTFFKYADNNKMTEDEKEKVLEIIEAYLFRRLICGVPTNALNKIFATLHNVIQKNVNEGAGYADALAYNLTSREVSGRFPKDDEFSAAIVEKDIYKMNPKNRKYIFHCIENGSRLAKEYINVVDEMEKDFHQWTIEHIMPQTLTPVWKEALGNEWEEIHKKWLNTLPNLTLTPYNGENSNLGFTEKKGIAFTDTTIKMNQEIAKEEKWSEEELKKRADSLKELALRIWAFPQTDYRPNIEDDELIAINEDKNFTGTTIEAIRFEDKMYSVKDWADAFVQLIKLFYEKDSSPIVQKVENEKDVYWQNSRFGSNPKEIVKDAIYVESNTSTNTKILMLQQLLKDYEMEEDDIAFKLHKK